MAIYHFSAKVISRSSGRSAVAAAAYRSASALLDERLGRVHDFTEKDDVIYSEVLLPTGAPERWRDRATLWNEVEEAEKRRDAQLAREIEIALPRELSPADCVELARSFVDAHFVSRGMVADLNVHRPIGDDGAPKPHAHVMLSLREAGEGGFGGKIRDWNATAELTGWREAWAEHCNHRLAELGHDQRIDHRSFEAQGIALEPQHKIGPAGARRESRGENAERAADHRRIARENGDGIIADPEIALGAITRGQATFTRRDLAMFIHRHSDGKAQFDRAMSAVYASAEIVALGKDGRGDERFTTREMLDIEQRLERAGDALADRSAHSMAKHHRHAALNAAASRGLMLSAEQQEAFEHVTGKAGLAAVVGYAGSGKSAMLGVAREAWERAGYTVRGAALSGIAAESLEAGSGIAARTLASLEYQWSQNRDLLTSGDVLVIDEAGMVGTRQMERVLTHAANAGAKAVLVGDPEQLQAIEAGAAFRAISERQGWCEITDIRRQKSGWQREATRALATARTADAIQLYASHGHVHAAGTREAARAALVAGWERMRTDHPGKTQIILTHTNDEVRDLNLSARMRLRDAGALGPDVRVATDRGGRDFAAGDRIMFLRNDRDLGVKNGTLGSVEQLSPAHLKVRLDDGRHVAFDLSDYAHVDHGYAATIHKAQGVTVDRVQVLATPGLDRHATYVALSRHRDAVELHYGRDDFADQRQLARILSRERTKDMASDYARAFADRREIRLPDELVRDLSGAGAGAPPKAPKRRGMFDGLKLSASPLAPVKDRPRAPGEDPALVRAVERVVRTAGDLVRMDEQGWPILEHQKVAFAKARQALDAVRPGSSADLVAAIEHNPLLINDVADGRVTPAIHAMRQEARVRADPELRAKRFVERWRELSAAQAEARRTGDRAGDADAEQALQRMTKSFERDPQMASILRRWASERDVARGSGQSIDIERMTERMRGRERGLER